MTFYSTHWEREKCGNEDFNCINVKITGLNRAGENVIIRKQYDEWIGVCTDNIQKITTSIKAFFPGVILKYVLLNENKYKKILPHFKDRLRKGKLKFSQKSFYKVYVKNALIHDVGFVMDKYKIAYYTTEDWLTRLFIDVCSKNNCENFYYSWYDVGDGTMLLDSFKINTTCKDIPHIKIAAFDLETVPLDGANRIPTGHNESDRIVMISIVKWNYKNPEDCEKILLYVNPTSFDYKFGNYFEFRQERNLLLKFHELIKDCHVLTGYNINKFDLPCLLARLLLLNMKKTWLRYSSKKIGVDVIVTFEKKIIIDMFTFIKTFSNRDLPNLKLDVVAQHKLGRNKFPIKATAIHHYYVKELTFDIFTSRDCQECYRYLQPKKLNESEFGTFADCLDYCLEDSVLVYELFGKELSLTFLMERANIAAINIEEALYYGNSNYILEIFKTFGTIKGYFLNSTFFNSNLKKDLEKYKPYLHQRENKNDWTYQGALNYANSGKLFESVTCLDFMSMYPSILINHNLSFETCSLFYTDEYHRLSEEVKSGCECVPYRRHKGPEVIPQEDEMLGERYKHPAVDFTEDDLFMVSYKNEKGFLTDILHVFLKKRKEIQKEYRTTTDTQKRYNLHTRQLNIKLFTNAIYGCMGGKNSSIACLEIAMSITCFARYYILAASHYAMLKMDCTTVYCDTDGIFLTNYPYLNCDDINRYLDQEFMILEYEKVMDQVLVISKKRYTYEENGLYKRKGFETRGNALTLWMTEKIIDCVFDALKTGEDDSGKGWSIWVNIMTEALYKCRDPKKYYITRNTKPLHEYKSRTLPQLKILEKDPSKAGGFIDYTYSQSDTVFTTKGRWITEVDECKEVNFATLFSSQDKILRNLFNVTFFHLANCKRACDDILNVLRLKSFVLADVRSLKKYKTPIRIYVLKSKKYPFNTI